MKCRVYSCITLKSCILMVGMIQSFLQKRIGCYYFYRIKRRLLEVEDFVPVRLPSNLFSIICGFTNRLKMDKLQFARYGCQRFQSRIVWRFYFWMKESEKTKFFFGSFFIGKVLRKVGG